MAKLIICDSGLGGLDVARRLFSAPSALAPADVIYFNAFPDAAVGYNDLPEPKQLEQFRLTLESMTRFAPAQVLIACNTLSIVWDKLRRTYTPPFPVAGITESAISMMENFLRTHENAPLFIAGTKTTVGSGFYRNALTARGIEANRLHGLALPGLAKLLERDPGSADVRRMIAEGAERAAAEIAPPRTLGLALCCTHYGYAEAIWREEFARSFPGTELALLNPNEVCVSGFRAASFAYHSRIDLFPGTAEHLAPLFNTGAPAISAALRHAQAEPELFKLVHP